MVLKGRNCRPLIAYRRPGSDPGMDLVDDRLGPPVPVGDRLGEQRAVGVQQAVVHRPGVDAEAGDLRVALAQLLQADQDLLVESSQVPAQMAVGFLGAVGKTVHDVELDTVVGPATRHHPTAGCADVDRAEHHLSPEPVEGVRSRRASHRRKAAATPASTGMCRPVVWDSSPPVSANDGVGDVLGQHLALEQGALGVVLAQVLLVHAVDRGALGAPAAGEDARSRGPRRRG